MKSTCVSTSQRIVPAIALALGHELEARVRPKPAADLRRRTAVRHDDVRGEVVRASNQRRADAVGVYGDVALLERVDLLGRESAGGNDPHALEAVAVERLAHLEDEPLVDAARIEVAHLVPERPIDQ